MKKKEYLKKFFYVGICLSIYLYDWNFWSVRSLFLVIIQSWELYMGNSVGYFLWLDLPFPS